jgi:hypothetical protein
MATLAESATRTAKTPEGDKLTLPAENGAGERLR